MGETGLPDLVQKKKSFPFILAAILLASSGQRRSYQLRGRHFHATFPSVGLLIFTDAQSGIKSANEREEWMREIGFI